MVLIATLFRTKLVCILPVIALSGWFYPVGAAEPLPTAKAAALKQKPIHRKNPTDAGKIRNTHIVNKDTGEGFSYQWTYYLVLDDEDHKGIWNLKPDKIISAVPPVSSVVAVLLLIANVNTLNRKLSSHDRETLEQYLNSVRDTEVKLHKAEQWIDTALPEVDADHLNLEVTVRDSRAYIQTIYDLIFLAFLSDSTRVATYMMGRENTGGPQDLLARAVGLNNAHSLTHDVKKPDGWRNLGTYNRFQTEVGEATPTIMNSPSLISLSPSRNEWASKPTSSPVTRAVLTEYKLEHCYIGAVVNGSNCMVLRIKGNYQINHHEN